MDGQEIGWSGPSPRNAIRCKAKPQKVSQHTVMILSFRTDRSEQTVQTQIRLLQEEQSDQGLHCLPFRLHGLDSLLYGSAT